jgi:MFS family permease
MSGTKIVITKDDLKKPSVQAQVNTQRNIRRMAADFTQNPATGGIVVGQVARSNSQLSSSGTSDTIYYLIAGLSAGLFAWAASEIQTSVYSPANVYASTMIFTSIIGVFFGLGLGAIDGVVEHSSQKALKGAAIGLFIGFFGGGISGLFGQFVYSFLLSTGSRDLSNFIFARTIAWGVVGIIIGTVPGVSLQAGKKIRNGMLGGVIGGAIGGALFDPIGIFLQSGVVSRLVGISITGGAMGVLISLTEEMMKEAWLLVEQGPLKGKQFILYKNPTRLGSSPNCEIYLFKDPSIFPEHTAINILSNGNSISTLNPKAQLQINGQTTGNSMLKHGDQISIGQYVFSYREKKNHT